MQKNILLIKVLLLMQKLLFFLLCHLFLVENKLPFDINDVPSATDQDGENLLNLLHEAQRLAYENGVANLSEEEIEAEIKAARRERHQR